MHSREHNSEKYYVIRYRYALYSPIVGKQYDVQVSMETGVNYHKRRGSEFIKTTLNNNTTMSQDEYWMRDN